MSDDDCPEGGLSPSRVLILSAMVGISVMIVAMFAIRAALEALR